MRTRSAWWLSRLRYLWGDIRIDRNSRVEDVLGHAVSAIEQAFERLEGPYDHGDVIVARNYLVAAVQILDHV